MRSTFKLIHSYFWKTFYGPIMSFIFPIILLGILGNIFRVEYVYPGIIAMSFMFIGLLSLPLTIMELKQSSLFKYIGSSPVNPLKFTIVVIGFYIFIAIIVAFIILISTIILFRAKVFPSAGFSHGILGGIFSFPGVISFYTSTGVHLIFVVASGLLISTFSKTPQQALTIGLIILIPSIFLSGMIISVDVIAESSGLNWISRFIPYRYSTGNIIIASTPKDQIGDMFQQLSYDQMKLMFSEKNINPNNGDIRLEIPVSWGSGTEVIRNMNDLEAIIDKMQGQFLQNPSIIIDQPLFNLTFGAALAEQASTSDNNIFNWVNAWSVRRIPQVDSVKDFIQQYFGSFQDKGKGGADWSRLQPIADQIALGKFGWLEIFMKQTNTLYLTADRVLNLLLPIALSVGAIWYTYENFQWSAR